MATKTKRDGIYGRTYENIAEFKFLIDFATAYLFNKFFSGENRGFVIIFHKLINAVTWIPLYTYIRTRKSVFGVQTHVNNNEFLPFTSTKS